MAAFGARGSRSAATSAMGCTAPTSLLTCMSVIRWTSSPSKPSSADRSTTPRRSTGIGTTLCPMCSASCAQFSTAGCSTDSISTRPGLCFVRKCPRMAILSASVPPEVNTMRWFAAPAAFRQISRALSTAFSASMAGRYSADGLYQPFSSASVIAAITAAEGFVVALLSR